ncbi:hypothetical protein SEPCBS119000_006490 [Sporothrix epigloea]|uniref:Asl1-like glycosyl hydrolase catalytic domain-containing protein n=1 Tax=Sporothrix epigloea TaxID=1892477 RepID=A0ABP0E3A3_9PEZI
MLNAKIVALAASMLAQQAVALNAHRHAHLHAHAKKAVKYVEDVVTVTDWTIVTVYEDLPAPTAAPKAIYKGGGHAELNSTSSASANSTISSTVSSSSSSLFTSSSLTEVSSSSSTLSSSSSSVYVPTTSSSIYTPTTLSTFVKPTSSSASATTSSFVQVEVQAAQVQIPTTSSTVIPPVPTSTIDPVAATAAATTATTAITAAIATSTPASSSYSGKGARGLAYNDGSLLSPFLGSGSKVNWSYNWGQTADSSAPAHLEFVPMLWSPAHADTWSANAAAAIANGASSLLSFNECDNAGQCNLDAASAAAAHIEHMNPFSGQARISTPAITNSYSPGEGVGWLAEFLQACNGQCAYDFCTVHWYNGPDSGDFLNHLMTVHETCGKPLWITEFAPTGSDEEISAFLETVMTAMDTDPTYSFVERYSYFMAATGSLLSSSTALSTYGNTYAFN